MVFIFMLWFVSQCKKGNTSSNLNGQIGRLPMSPNTLYLTMKSTCDSNGGASPSCGERLLRFRHQIYLVRFRKRWLGLQTLLLHMLHNSSALDKIK